MTKEEVLAELFDQLLKIDGYYDNIYLDSNHTLDFRKAGKYNCIAILKRNITPYGYGSLNQFHPFLGYNQIGELIEFFSNAEFYIFEPNTNKDNGIKFCTKLTDDIDGLILYFQTKLIELT